LIPGKGWEFALHNHVQISSGAHMASYSVGTKGKAAGA